MPAGACEFIATPGGHLLTYVSRSSLGSRLLAQRLDAAGNAQDVVPVEVTTWPADIERFPASACDGSQVMIAWTDATNLGFVRRYGLDLQPLDAQPVQVFSGVTGSPSLASANGQFLVIGVFPVTIDTDEVRGVRVQGSNSAVLDPTPFFIGGNYVSRAHVEALGGSYLVYWTHSATHNTPVTTILCANVATSGQVGPVFQASSTFYANAADFAVQGNEALLVYQTGESYGGVPDSVGRCCRSSSGFP